MASTSDQTRKPRRRHWGLKLFLASLFGLLLLEGGLRTLAWATNNNRGMSFHSALGWAPISDITKKGNEWSRDLPAQTNSRGWRDAEHPAHPVPGRKRIVLLGDSMTFGQGVDYGERFSEVMEVDLPDHDVVNLGVPGYGTDQQVLSYEVEGRHYAPEIAVLVTFLGNDLNDIRHSRHWRWPKPWFRFDDGGALQLMRPEPDFWVRVRLSGYIGEAAARVFDRSEPSTRAAPWTEGDTVPLYRALVRRLRKQTEANGTKLFIVLLHAKRKPGQRLLGVESRVYAAVQAESFPHLDSRTAIDPAMLAGQDPWLRDGHLAPLGHRLLGHAISSRLRDLGWLE